MPDFNPSIALDFKAPPAPDLVGPITSLAQWQNAQANAQRTQADVGLVDTQTQAAQQSLAFNQALIAAKIDYASRVAAGEDPISALSTSKLGPLAPELGAQAMTNVNSSLDIRGKEGYGANPANPYSAAAGGPAMVGQAATAAATLSKTSGQTELNKGVADAMSQSKILAPGDTPWQGPAAYAAMHGQPIPAMPGSPPSLSNSSASPAAAPANPGSSVALPSSAASQLHGQLGAIMASDPSPQGRARAAAFARQIPLGPGSTPAMREQQIQQFLALPNDQYVLAGQHFQQASMTPERYMTASGQPAGNQAAATAPQQQVVLPSAVSPNGAPSTGVAPLPGNFGAPGPGVATEQPSSPGAPPNASQGGSGSPGLSNNARNNPGNLKDSPFAQSQPGYIGASNGFAIFQSPLLGQAAMEKNLASYGRQGVNTPLAIASKWAPAGDGANNPQNYASFVAGRLGIGVNDKINLADPQQRSAVAVAMSQMENGASGTNVAAKLTPAAFSPAASNPGPAIAPAASIPGSAPILPTGGFSPALTAPKPAPVALAQPAAVGRPAGIAPPVAPPVAAAAQTGAPSSGSPRAGPTVPLPAGYQPVDAGMSISEKAAQDRIGAGWGDQVNAATEAAQNAQIAQIKLGELQHNLAALPDKSGFLTPGAGATERVGFAKYMNTIESAAGISDSALTFDPKQVAAAEASQKITGGLGYDMARGQGAREAASIVQQSIHLQPGIENTPQGKALVAAAINAGLQRQVDYHNFLAANGNKEGSDLAFNRAYPVSKYVQEAQRLAQIPQDKIDLLQQHAANPQAAASFDAAYGSGMSRYYVGQ